MPSTWITPIETARTKHKIEQVSFASEMNSLNAMMRIDQGLERVRHNSANAQFRQV